MPGYNEADEGSGDSGVMAPNGPSKDAVKKLDQIIQVGINPWSVGQAIPIPESLHLMDRISIPKLPLLSCSLGCPYL
jgi:hypothetical protein